MKYLPTKIQEQIPAATSTLQANETQQIYPVMQGPTSILEVKKPMIEEKSYRSNSADAVHAIFYLTEKNKNSTELLSFLHAKQRQ